MPIGPHLATNNGDPTIFESHPGRIGLTGTGTATTGQFVGSLIATDPGAILRGLSVPVNAAAVGQTNAWAALLDTAYNVLAVSPDALAVPAFGAIGTSEFTFTTAILAPGTEIWAGFVFVGTTGPSVWAQTLQSAYVADAVCGGQRRMAGNLGGTSTPWTVGSNHPLTAIGIRYYMALHP